ncbi:MAG: acyltransferase family protein [Rubripirellula sp.]|nr:acyltransferase family protein [Rubripirellula sp.]
MSTSNQNLSNAGQLSERRHDLDALRAFAMLLGIGLHAAIAYIPNIGAGWPVSDINTQWGFGVFLAAVHGFRMPLFFLLSGFFTAMLWRKRGLDSLIRHRMKRIVLPLFLGMFTVVPAVWVVSIWAENVATHQDELRLADASSSPLWTAVYTNDSALLEEAIAADPEIDLDQLDLRSGMTPLALASAHNWSGFAGVLLDHDANVDARCRDQGTATHAAFFFGQSEAGELLVERGADLGIRNQYQATPVDNLNADLSLARGLADAMQLRTSEAGIAGGRQEIKSFLGLQDAQEISVVTEDQAEGVWKAVYGLITFLALIPIFHHLWFLWFLCWLLAGFVIYAAVMDQLGWKGPPAWLTVSPFRYGWIILLTLLPQSVMGLLYPVFGPDTSTGLIPLPPVLFYYAIFFAFGVWYFDADDVEGRVGKHWRITLPIALFVVFPLGYEFTLGVFGFGDQLLSGKYHRAASVILQVTYVWLMSFGMMGLARKLFAGENTRLRYISDSSYWLYLIHLPLVILLQLAVRTAPYPPILKFLFVVMASSILMLLSYQWFVRYTLIGTLLNGKKIRPGKELAAVQAVPMESMQGTSQ